MLPSGTPKTSLLRHLPLHLCLSRKPCDRLLAERDKESVWHNDQRVERFSSAVIGMIGLGMLIGPLWDLYKVGPSNSRLGIISAFIVVFYFLVIIAMTAKVFESFAAVAAYSAVLMFFYADSGQFTFSQGLKVFIYLRKASLKCSALSFKRVQLKGFKSLVINDNLRDCVRTYSQL